MRAALYLPSYSADLDPIEQAFAKVEGPMRKEPGRAPAGR